MYCNSSTFKTSHENDKPILTDRATHNSSSDLQKKSNGVQRIECISKTVIQGKAVEQFSKDKSQENFSLRSFFKFVLLVTVLTSVGRLIKNLENFPNNSIVIGPNEPMPMISLPKDSTDIGPNEYIPTIRLPKDFTDIGSNEPMLSCPSNEMTCNKDDLQSSQNYLCRPGYHSIKSVVAGSRAAELNAVKAMIKSDTTLKKLETSLYREENVELIPKECREVADEVASEMFSRYIDKYRHCGLNEKNAIRWSPWDFRQGVTYVSDLENEWNTWHIQSIVAKNGLLGKNRYFPPGIVAYHELMHIEETPLFAPEKYHQDGVELLTSLTTTMQLDEAFKKCKKLDLSTEVDYQKNLKIDDISIPIGKLANCYRILNKNFGSLVNAVLSSKSISFLKTGVCEI